MDTKNFQFIRGARILQQLEKELLIETTYADLERNTMQFIPKTKKRQHALASVQVEGMEFTPIPSANNLLIESIVRNYDSDTKPGNAVYGPKILFQEVDFLRLEGLEEGIWDKAKEWWKGRKDRRAAAKELDKGEPIEDTEDAKQALDAMDREDPNQPEEPEEPETEQPEQPGEPEQPETEPEEPYQQPAGSIILQAKNGKEFTIMPIQLTKHNCRVSCNCLDFFWRFALYAHKDQSLLGTDLGVYRKRTNRPPVNPRQVPALCKHLLKLAIELKNSGVVR